MTLQERLRGVRLAAFDVDGVFTDGRLYISNDLVESKAFCTLDGYGIRCLLGEGIEVAVISGRNSPATAMRMRELGIGHVYLGCSNKVGAFEELLKALSLRPQQCLYAGDDLPDLDLLKKVGVSVAVSNAHPDIKAACDLTTTLGGGRGAVREICDTLLAARRNGA